MAFLSISEWNLHRNPLTRPARRIKQRRIKTSSKQITTTGIGCDALIDLRFLPWGGCLETRAIGARHSDPNPLAPTLPATLPRRAKTNVFF